MHPEVVLLDGLGHSGDSILHDGGLGHSCTQGDLANKFESVGTAVDLEGGICPR